ncbi:MAG: hypothetical protein ACRDRJ_35965 [Streptosporangiaceae bacterium]
MISQDQLNRLDEVIRRAQAAGNADVLAKAVDLLGRALRQNAAETAKADEADPMTRARTRKASPNRFQDGTGFH